MKKGHKMVKFELGFECKPRGRGEKKGHLN